MGARYDDKEESECVRMISINQNVPRSSVPSLDRLVNWMPKSKGVNDG